MKKIIMLLILITAFTMLISQNVSNFTPKSFSATSGDTRVALIWYAPDTTGAPPFEMYYLYKDGIRILETKATSYLDTLVVNDIGYRYTISAVYQLDNDELGESNTVQTGSSETDAITTPHYTPPRSLSPSYKDQQVVLVWEAPLSNSIHKNHKLLRYKVLRGPNADNLTELPNAETTSLSFTDDNNVVNGNTYAYAVRAIYQIPDGSEKQSINSNVVSGSPAYLLATPRNVYATAKDNEIELYWESPDLSSSNATFLYFKVRKGSQLLAPEYQLSDLPITDTEVTNFVEVTYNVFAYYTQGTSLASNAASVFPGLYAPKNITYTPGDEKVIITWETPDPLPSSAPSTLKLVSYYIFRDKTGMSDVHHIYIISPTDSNTYIFTDFGLTNGQEYQYFVRANYDTTNNPPSNLSPLKNGGDVVVTPFIKYNSIENLTGIANEGTVCLTWDALEHDPVLSGVVPISIQIYRDGIYKYSCEPAKTTIIDSDPNFIDGIKYSYYVRVKYDDNNESEKSNLVTISPIPLFNPPQNVQIDVTSKDRTVILTWMAPLPTFTGILNSYEIYLIDDEVDPTLDRESIRTLVQVVEKNYNTFTFTNLKYGERLAYSIRATYKNLEGASDFIDFEGVIIKKIDYVFNPPRNLTSTIRDKYVTLTWEEPEAESDGELVGYHVYRNGIRVTTNLLTNLIYWDDTIRDYKLYSYYITAAYANETGHSAPSNTIKVRAKKKNNGCSTN